MQKFTIILFRLPDGRLVLQRRTKDAPYGADKLTIFGGWVDKGETPDECIKREINEETNLDPSKFSINLAKDFVIPKSEDFSEDRHFYLYEADIANLTFAVYEGQGAEAYTLSDLKKRDDLTGSAQFVVRNILQDG